jgi:hypothetical protein
LRGKLSVLRAVNSTGQGGTNRFRFRLFRSRPQCAADETVATKRFSLGALLLVMWMQLPWGQMQQE